MPSGQDWATYRPKNHLPIGYRLRRLKRRIIHFLEMMGVGTIFCLLWSIIILAAMRLS